MDDVQLVPYDPAWPSLFATESKRLRARLDPAEVLGVEHFGSMWRRRLAFRDHPRTSPAAAARYAADRERYTDAKSDFIERVYREIGV